MSILTPSRKKAPEYVQSSQPQNPIDGQTWYDYQNKVQMVYVGLLSQWVKLSDLLGGDIGLPGTLWAWGMNANGSLGDGTGVAKSSPIQVGTSTDWSRISSGQYHNLATKIDGTLWTWGDNSGGILGLGDIISRSSPTQVGNLTTWKYVSAHLYYSAAIKTDGTLWMWGDNSYGSLGDALGSRSSPVQVGLQTTWKKVITMLWTTLALKIDGTICAWGRNTYGTIGDGTIIDKTSPIQIGSLNNWRDIAAGQYHCLATKNDGSLWSWGNNTLGGQLGDGTVINESSPIQIGGSASWTKVFRGLQYNSAAIKLDNSLWTWSKNSDYGQLGDGTTISKSFPVQVGNLMNWKNIEYGFYHAVAIKTDGTLWTWSDNSKGELGDTTTVTKSSPVQVGALTTWLRASGGVYHTVAIHT